MNNIEYIPSEINIKILKIWYKFLCGHNHHYNVCTGCKNKGLTSKPILMPILYPKMKRNRLLCIGLNPSHSEKYYKNKKNKSINLNVFNTNCFSFNPNSYKEIIELYQEGITEYKNYYNKIHEVSKYINLEKEHIDIFVFRSTCSKCLEGFNAINHQFTEEQKEIAKQLIIELSPSMILVGSAKASKIFEKDLFGENCVYLDSFGYHITKIGKKRIPTFLSGQLSGGVTDKYSFARLKFLMKKAKYERDDLGKIS